MACEVQSLGKEPINHQIINNSFHASNLPSFNDDIVLDKSEIFKSLLLSKSLVEVNLCIRPSSTQGESTSVQFTQTDDSQRFQFDEEMDMLMQDNDVLSYVKFGIPVQLDSPLYSGDIKPKRIPKT